MFNIQADRLDHVGGNRFEALSSKTAAVSTESVLTESSLSSATSDALLAIEGMTTPDLQSPSSAKAATARQQESVSAAAVNRQFDNSYIDGKRIDEMSRVERLQTAFTMATSEIGPELAAQIDNLLEPENLKLVTGVLAIWGAAHLNGSGQAADVVMIGAAAMFGGMDALRAINHLAHGIGGALNAKTRTDFDGPEGAAMRLAQGIIKAGETGMSIPSMLGALKKISSFGNPRPSLAPGSISGPQEAGTANASVSAGRTIATSETRAVATLPNAKMELAARTSAATATREAAGRTGTVLQTAAELQRWQQFQQQQRQELLLQQQPQIQQQQQAKQPPSANGFPAPAKIDFLEERIHLPKEPDLDNVYLGSDDILRQAELYRDPNQAFAALLANRIYGDLKIDVSKSQVFTGPDGNLWLATDFNPNASQINLSDTSLTAIADNFLDGFSADVLVGNAGSGLFGADFKNLRVVGERAIRNNTSGSFLHTAEGGRKWESALDQIPDFKDYFDAGTNWHYGLLAYNAGYADPTELGSRLTNQVNAIVRLRDEAGGWDGYDRKAMPEWSGADRDRIVQMLEARTKTLCERVNTDSAAVSPAVETAPVDLSRTREEFRENYIKVLSEELLTEEAAVVKVKQLADPQIAKISQLDLLAFRIIAMKESFKDVSKALQSNNTSELSDSSATVKLATEALRQLPPVKGQVYITDANFFIEQTSAPSEQTFQSLIGNLFEKNASRESKKIIVIPTCKAQ